MLDALPAEPDAIVAVAGQIAGLAIERANTQNQKETESLQAALQEREAQASELQTRCDELLSDHVTLTEDLASAHDSIARLEGEKAALAASVRTLAERIQKLEAFKRTLIASLQDDTPGAVAAGMSSGGGGSSLWGEAVKAAPPPEGERLVQEILANAKPAALPQRPQLLHGDSSKFRDQRACDVGACFLVSFCPHSTLENKQPLFMFASDNVDASTPCFL